jgi:hypothetical protein
MPGHSRKYCLSSNEILTRKRLNETYANRYMMKQQMRELLPPDPHLNTEERFKQKRLATISVPKQADSTPRHGNFF